METLAIHNVALDHPACDLPEHAGPDASTARVPADPPPTGVHPRVVGSPTARTSSWWSPSLDPPWWRAGRRWAGRHKLWLGGGALGALGLALGWNWLAAAGVLSVLLPILPCALMMAVCMKGMRSCQKTSSPQDKQAADPTAQTDPLVSPRQGSSASIEENDRA